MFLGNPDRKGGAGAFIGYDISDRYAQISFWLPGADKPEHSPRLWERKNI